MRIDNITTDSFNVLMSQAKTNIIIIKFSATWCKPCKIVSPTFEQYIIKHSQRDDVIIGCVDIDTSDFYKELKRKRMINGIPCIMAFYNNNNNNNNLPDDSVTGSNLQDVYVFLNRCDVYINELNKSLALGYNCLTASD